MIEPRSIGQVEVFTQAHCGSCRQLEAFLRDRGVAFEARHVDEDPAALEELAARGFMTTPVTRIGDQWVTGFKKRKLERALASLDRAEARSS